MKNLIVFLIGLAMLSLWSCGGRHSRELTLVDSLLTAGEVSQAVDSLNRIDTLARQYGARDMNYYRLLKVMADDRSYVTHTTDSLIVPVIKYYERHGSDRELAKAYYYGGSVYRDLGDAPQALDYFQKALDVLTQSGCDRHLEGVTYSQMGELYTHQRVYDLALEMYNHSYKCSVEEKDSLSLIYDLTSLGDMYAFTERPDTAIYYYCKALEMTTDKSVDSRVAPMIYSQLVGLYIDLGDYPKAKSYLDKCMYSHADIDKGLVLSEAAIYYYMIGQLDSAEIYSKELLQVGNIYHKTSSYARLAEIEIKRKNPQKAMEYAENFLDYRNSVEKQTKTEEMRRINAVYNYHLREKENNRLKTENKKMWYWLIGAAIVILILVGIIYIVILYAKNRRMKHRIAVEKLHRMEKDYHERSEEFIAENTEKILRLEKQLRDISNYNNELKVKIEEQKETLEAANKLARMDIRRHAEALERISESTIYGKIQLVLRDDNKMLRKEDWKELENEVLNEFPNFRDALMSLTYEIKEQE